MPDNARFDGVVRQATDEINGIHYPRQKVGFGSDGTYEDVSESNGMPVSPPTATTVLIVAATTSATGANWVTFGNNACNALDLVNTTGVTIEYRRNGAGSAIQIPTSSSRLIIGITNTNQISIRRYDQDPSPVTVAGESYIY